MPSPHQNKQVVVPALLDIYQTILGLKFEKDAALTKEAWAAGVDAYKVRRFEF